MSYEITLEETCSVLNSYNREFPDHVCVGLQHRYLRFNRENIWGLQKLLNRISRHIDGAGARESDLEPGWTFDILNVVSRYDNPHEIFDYYDLEECLRVQYGVSNAVIYAAFWAFDINYRGVNYPSYEEYRPIRKARDARRAEWSIEAVEEAGDG